MVPKKAYKTHNHQEVGPTALISKLVTYKLFQVLLLLVAGAAVLLADSGWPVLAVRKEARNCKLLANQFFNGSLPDLDWSTLGLFSIVISRVQSVQWANSAIFNSRGVKENHSIFWVFSYVIRVSNKRIEGLNKIITLSDKKRLSQKGALVKCDPLKFDDLNKFFVGERCCEMSINYREENRVKKVQ